jgi:hypothetical protein
MEHLRSAHQSINSLLRLELHILVCELKQTINSFVVYKKSNKSRSETFPLYKYD